MGLLRALSRWYKRNRMTDELFPADTASDLFLVQWNERAQRAYNAYGASVGQKNFAGAPMPAWPELPRRIRAAWCLATQAVFLDAKVACTQAAVSELNDYTEGDLVHAVTCAIEEIP